MEMNLEKVAERLLGNNVSMAQKFLLLRSLETKSIGMDKLKSSNIVNIVKKCCEFPGKTGELALNILGNWNSMYKDELNVDSGNGNKDLQLMKEKIKEIKISKLAANEDDDDEDDATCKLYPEIRLYGQTRKAVKRRFSEDNINDNGCVKVAKTEEEMIHGVPLLTIKNFNCEQLRNFESVNKITSDETETFWQALVHKNFMNLVNSNEINDSWKNTFIKYETEKENKLKLINDKIRKKVAEDEVNTCRIKLIETNAREINTVRRKRCNANVREYTKVSKYIPKIIITEEHNVSKCRPKVTEDDKVSLCKQRAIEDNKISLCKPKVTQDNNVKNCRPKVTEDNKVSLCKPKVTEDNKVSKCKTEVTEDYKVKKRRPKVTKDNKVKKCENRLTEMNERQINKLINKRFKRL